MNQDASQKGGGLIPWEPRAALRSLDPVLARLSRGFLRCRPEKWFPGFGAHWLPLAHSLGLEMRVQEVKPVLAPPHGLAYSFVGTVDDEPLVLSMDDAASRSILEGVTPGALNAAQDIVAEYLARRLLGSLAVAWSGPQSSIVRFDTERDPNSLRVAGAVKLGLSLNGSPCSIWISLGSTLVERFDGLWRRQVQSTARDAHGMLEVAMELSHITVPPAMLGDYTRPGTVIDLEVVQSDMITLRAGGRPWLPARLAIVRDALAFETISGPVTSSPLPEGTTRLSIELGRVTFDAALLAEMSQAGAVYTTDLGVGNRVQLVINGERVAEAVLCTYEGRFAVNVL